MKYLGKITDNKDLVTKEYVDNAVISGSGEENVIEIVKVNNTALTPDANKAVNVTVPTTASDVGAVPTTRKVNNKALSSDITLSASDVSAVPTSRKVNSKALSSDISLSASDVSALPISGGTMTGDGQIINGHLTNSASRETSANLTPTGKRGITALLASGTMTTGRPFTNNEGTIIHCEWDTTGGWNSQLFVADNDSANGKPYVAVRGQRSGTWTDWDKLVADSDKYKRSSAGTLDWSNQTDGDAKVIAKSALAYWNGAYSGTSSNLAYCNKGAFGTLATKNSLSASDVGFIFDTYTKSITVPGTGAYNFTISALTQRSGYTLMGYINKDGGYTDQWLISYGTYGSNIVAMVYSKYGASLTNNVSCTAIWVKS